MPYLFFFFLIIILMILVIAVIFITPYSKNSLTELYREGVRDENNGCYIQALQKFEEVLVENKKFRLDYKFSATISNRIKVLRSLILFENNFQPHCNSNN
jgi:hypothetical protein